MDTEEFLGVDISYFRGERIKLLSPELRREHMAEMGKIKTHKKAESARKNGEKGGAYPVTEENRSRRSASQRARRERERAEGTPLKLA